MRDLIQVQTELNNRTNRALNVTPNQVATDPRGAIESAHQYVDAVKGGLSDGKITQSELSNIAQLGANANASIQARGGPEMRNTPNSINNLTTQIARGQLPAARGSVDSLERSLPARP